MSSSVAALFATVTATTPVEAWSARTGQPLSVPDDVRVQPLPGGIALVGVGVALQLASGDEDGAVEAVVEEQLAPFRQAGSTVPDPKPVACTVGGAATTCLGVTVEVVPGATLRVLAGQRPGADWTATCLQRSSASSSLCDLVVKRSPKPQ